MTRPAFPLRPAASLLTLAVLLLTGCWKDRVVWSPDGSRAAIITKDGLQLCAADGRLTPLLAPGVYRAAWLGDSQDLVLARSRSVDTYAALTAALGPERSKALAEKAELVFQEWQALPRGEKPPIQPDDDIGAIALYLREHHFAALRQKLAEEPNFDPKDLDSLTAAWHSIVVAHVEGDRLVLGATLAEGLSEIHELRPAPNARAVAFVAQAPLNLASDDGLCILVVPVDGSLPAIVVASHTAAYPDWTPDSRALVYFKAQDERASASELQLGALVERGVLDDAGHLQLADKTRDLAGLIFQSENRVRCLRDGRVIFDAAEIHLPLAGSNHRTHEQLFALDRTKKPLVLVPLISPVQLGKMPDTLAFFDVSPDERQALIRTETDVAILTLATGAVEPLALGMIHDDSNHNPPLPVWRRPGEIVYLKKEGARNELILRRGAEETVLSRSWPDEVLARLIE